MFSIFEQLVWVLVTGSPAAVDAKESSQCQGMNNLHPTNQNQNFVFVFSIVLCNCV